MDLYPVFLLYIRSMAILCELKPLQLMKSATVGLELQRIYEDKMGASLFALLGIVTKRLATSLKN